MCNTGGTPRRHAELIKRWADGETIEFKNDAGDWVVVREAHYWSDRGQYRVKSRSNESFTLTRLRLLAQEFLSQHDCDSSTLENFLDWMETK